jgi:signal transduction histidine kinase
MVVGDSRHGSGRCSSPESGEVAARFLVRVGEELAESLDYETTLQRVAQQAVPCLADVSIVELVASEGRLQPVASAHVDSDKDDWFRDLAVNSGIESPPMTLRALRTRRPVIVADVSDSLLKTIADEERVHIDPRIIAAIHAVGGHAGIALPLIARDRVLGVLSLVRLDVSTPFEQQEVPLIQHLTRQCAQAVDNARLYREATEAANAREEFLATTSHELRTPLSKIKGFVTTLLRTDVEWDAATRDDFLREIDSGADVLDELISDLLEMSRLASGASNQFQRASSQPAVLVFRGLSRLRGRLPQSTVEVDESLSNLPPVWADPRRIEQVIVNLVDNAIKYAPGSNIHISGRATEARGLVELLVEDDGPGIPSDDLEHIFERFYRGRSREKSESPGTGLGLAIARAIVEGHGGQMRAENRPAGGARFIVSLPTAA